MKKIKIIAIIAFIFLIFFGQDVYHNSVDYIYWKQLSSNIKTSTISKVILESGNPIELKNNEKKNFIKNLSEAKFYKSNWRKIGPTGPTIGIMFKDGKKLYFEYWGNAKFELTLKKEQFLIRSADIERFMKEYNITL